MPIPEFTKNLAIEKGVDENKLFIINPGTDIHENDDLDENYAEKFLTMRTLELYLYVD